MDWRRRELGKPRVWKSWTNESKKSTGHGEVDPGLRLTFFEDFVEDFGWELMVVKRSRRKKSAWEQEAEERRELTERS